MTRDDAAGYIRDLRKGRGKRPIRRLKRNTYIDERPDGAVVITLHWTEIITVRPDNTIELNTGGWWSNTTRSRMNEYLNCGHVCSHKGDWFCATASGPVPFVGRLCVLDKPIPNGNPIWPSDTQLPMFSLRSNG